MASKGTTCGPDESLGSRPGLLLRRPQPGLKREAGREDSVKVFRGLREQLFRHHTRNIRQPEVASAVVVSQPLVVQTHQV